MSDPIKREVEEAMELLHHIDYEMVSSQEEAAGIAAEAEAAKEVIRTAFRQQVRITENLKMALLEIRVELMNKRNPEEQIRLVNGWASNALDNAILAQRKFMGKTE